MLPPIGMANPRYVGVEFGAKRDFLWTLIRTDFKARYHGAASGFLWALLKPLLMFAVLFGVFSFLFKNETYLWNLLIGLLLWDFFSEGTRAGIYALSSKSYLLTKARFPRWLLVVTSSVNATITLMVWSLSILVVLVLTRKAPPLWALGLFLVYLILYACIVLGIGLAGSVLYLKYRDLEQIWDVILQAGFFLAPIFYPLAVLPERYHFFLFVWPVTPVLQFSRSVLVLHEAPTLKANLFLFGVAAFVLSVGILVFRKYSAHVVEEL
jgi:lipopolysaccharide transport system permease protein